MACHEAVLTGDVHQLIAHREDEILRGSISSTREKASEQSVGDALLVVRTFLQKAVDARSGFGRGDHRSGGSDLIG